MNSQPAVAGFLTPKPTEVSAKAPAAVRKSMQECRLPRRTQNLADQLPRDMVHISKQQEPCGPTNPQSCFLSKLIPSRRHQ